MIEKVKPVSNVSTNLSLRNGLPNNNGGQQKKEEKKEQGNKTFDVFLVSAIYEKQEGDSVKILKR